MKPLLTIIAALVAFGCSDPEAAVVGRWTAKPLLTAAQQARPDAAKMESLAGGSLQISKEKHAFTRTFGNGVALEGTWSFDGKLLTLMATSMNGHSIAETKARMLKIAPTRPNPELARRVANELGEPDKLKINSDGTMQSVDSAAAAQGIIIYRKEGK